MIYSIEQQMEALRSWSKPDRYDCAVVLGNRVQAEDGEYIPSRAGQADESGIVGGDIRVDGAVALCFSGRASNFLFSGGATSSLNYQIPDLPEPPEADVYHRAFTRRLCEASAQLGNEASGTQCGDLVFDLERESMTTFEGVCASRAILRAAKRRKTVYVTNFFHTGRLEEMIRERIIADGPGPNLCYVEPAESLAIEAFGYSQRDRHAKACFGSGEDEVRPEMFRRRINEMLGLVALAEGRYGSDPQR